MIRDFQKAKENFAPWVRKADDKAAE